MAPPTKLNAEVQRIITTALEVGNTVDVSCRLGGIDRATFVRWMAGSSEAQRRFQRAVRDARTKAESDLVAMIWKSAHKGSYRAATWLLTHLSEDDLLRLSTPAEGEDGDEGEGEGEPQDTLAAISDLAAQRRKRAARS